MNRIYLIFFALLFFPVTTSFSQKQKTDANIIGHVVSEGVHIPFANVFLKGTTIGTASDQTGHYSLVNVPADNFVIIARAIGYKSQEIYIQTMEGNTIEVNFELQADLLNLEEVVISADRNAIKRNDATIIVNTLTPFLFESSQSSTLSEGLNFSPGLRIENNCQNCGFTQLRINGMEGPYTQILINNRPIFSGLAGVYGLELIPSNMIERVEVVRGGGSVLYGSNAIAGTVNLILKDPVINSWEVDAKAGAIGTWLKDSGKPAPDKSLSFNTSIISDDQKTGLSMFAFIRDRKFFDANDDGFSEISPLSNITVGSRVFHKFGYRSKLAIDFFNIREERAGGNRHDYPLHERDIAEAVIHDLYATAVTWEKYYRDYDLFSVFGSVQNLDRDSYYGAGRSLSDYGKTKDITYNIGAQYKFVNGNSSILAGIENTGGYLNDKKLGYPDYKNAVIEEGIIVEVPHTSNIEIADQLSFTSGAFTQYEIKVSKLKITGGLRFDNYRIEDLKNETALKTGNVFSPRFGILYNLTADLQTRLSYASGYRVPQIFDEDLHIETSGSRRVINRNDPDLKQETSHSITGSIDFSKVIESISLSILTEGFYTRLTDPFVNEIGVPDEEGIVYYTRINAKDGAVVKGANIEFKLMSASGYSLTSGFTVQSSIYDEEQEFNERKFFRSPKNYGFFTLDKILQKNLTVFATGTYTGKMLVPYFGPDTDPVNGELRTSNPFFDFGIKMAYLIRINGSGIQLYSGIKNIFNSYQSDFDTGENRDPTYMYGPVMPRMIYFGLKVGNVLK